MSKSLFFPLVCFLLLSNGLTVFADSYDDCIKVCNDKLAPCIDQARLNAGNIQEEEDSVSACEKGKADCIQACSDAEAQPQSPPPPPEQPKSE
jgi:hypothetical protein